MKTIKHRKFLIVGLFAATIIMIFGCQSDATENNNHEVDMHAHDDYDEPSEKVVELTKRQFELTDIKLGEFEMKNMSEVLNVNGYTKLPPHNQADVSVHVGGLIRSIKVLEGQYVKKGRTVATIESPEFAKLHQAYLSSKSKLTYLEQDFKRQELLRESEANTEKELQKIKSDLDVEKAQFKSLEQQLRLLHMNPKGPTSTVVSIVAPISGHITDVMVKIGSAVMPNTPLFSIVDNSEMHVDLLVYEKDLYKVKLGQKLRFVLTNQSHTEINGTIFNIGKSFENETKSVAVHAHIDDHEVALIPGMYINALIDVGTHKVATLPASAIVNDLGRKYIFVLETNNHVHENHEGHDHEKTESDDQHFDFRRVEIKTGAEQLGSVEVNVMGVLKDSDKIVIDGSFYLQSHLQKSEGGGGHEH